MPLKAKKPEETTKRLKLFLFGAASTGKTRCALQFPKTYFFDCEKGTDNYNDLFEESGSVRMQTTDVNEIVDELRQLATTKHDYKTVCIDPMTILESDLVLKAEDQGLDSFAVWRMRDRVMKRVENLLYKLDMNVIVICHGKIDYGDNMKKLGTTYDGWKRWIFVFDLAIELYRAGSKTHGLVRKTRLKQFPEGEDFLFSYTAIADRFGKEIVEKPSQPIELANADDVTKLTRLLGAIVIPKGTVERWKTKAGVEDFAEMTTVQIGACIEYLEKKGRGEK
ncbi:hypothetical protein LCGC14_2020670 [marine sediment metagenome]|uniref:AAA domain-containing protein n=1 Tax=marine sediment metagenome TaxID=412755 RepID=A0A0F9FK63_9ZZZZ